MLKGKMIKRKKGFFSKWCEDCGKWFKPCGRSQTLCDDCQRRRRNCGRSKGSYVIINKEKYRHLIKTTRL